MRQDWKYQLGWGFGIVFGVFLIPKIGTSQLSPDSEVPSLSREIQSVITQIIWKSDPSSEAFVRLFQIYGEEAALVYAVEHTENRKIVIDTLRTIALEMTNGQHDAVLKNRKFRNETRERIYQLKNMILPTEQMADLRFQLENAFENVLRALNPSNRKPVTQKENTAATQDLVSPPQPSS